MIVGLGVARVTEDNEVGRVVMALHVIDVMNRIGAASVGLLDATESAGVVVSLADLLFESIRKLVVVLRFVGVRKAISHAVTGNGTISATTSIRVEKTRVERKRFPALFTDTCDELPCASPIIALRRAMFTAALGYRSMGYPEFSAAMLANPDFAQSSPISKTLARAKAMPLRLCMKRCATDWLAAVLARLNPATVSTGARAKAPLVLGEMGGKLLATSFADMFDSFTAPLAGTRSRTAYLMVRGERRKLFATNWTSL